MAIVTPENVLALNDHFTPEQVARYVEIHNSLETARRMVAGTAHEPFMREMLKNVVQIAMNAMPPEVQP